MQFLINPTYTPIRKNGLVCFGSRSFQNSLRKYDNPPKTHKITKHLLLHDKYKSAPTNKENRLKIYKQKRIEWSKIERQGVKKFIKKQLATQNISFIKQDHLIKPVYQRIVNQNKENLQNEHEKTIEDLLMSLAQIQPKQQFHTNEQLKIIEEQSLQIKNIERQLLIQKSSEFKFMECQQSLFNTESIKTKKYRLSFRLVDKLYKQLKSIQQVSDAIFKQKPRLKQYEEEIVKQFNQRYCL